MRGSSAMKLLSACCGGLLMSMPVDAAKEFYDYRTGNDFGSDANCENAETDNTRYIQVEVFDYNLTPWIKATYTQIADECGGNNFTPYSASMEYNGNEEGDVTDSRLQMDMYICAPFGEYELEIQVKSTNGGSAMERVAWEIEYGPDEYHIWDTLNTPFFGSANGATPADLPYAPIPNEYSGSGDGTTYKWPLSGSEGYYSTLYTGPFPPNECSNLYPSGVDYEGCYPQQSGWTSPTAGPSGSSNAADPAEPYRMFDGLGSGDGGVDEDGVMTLGKCAGICSGYSYMGLQSAVQCICGNSISGDDELNCGLVDDTAIPEYKYLCSGDSRVLCGTDTKVSIYSLDGTGPTPTPPPVVPGDYESLGCSKDDQSNRVMSLGPITLDTMSAEICLNYCLDQGEDYTYFGTQYGAECWCATTVADDLDFNHDGCDMACANNADEKCGGNDAISVYEIGEAPTPAPVTPTPSGGGGFESLGCSEDDKSNRVMALGPITQDTMSAEICLNYCTDLDEGYAYFGTQYSAECWCATTVADDLDLGYGGCDMACANNAGETCGGNNAISVYKIDEVGTTPAPTPTPVGGDSYDSLGCFADAQPGPSGQEVRIMADQTSSNDMTAEVCFGLCDDGTNTHFGTQWGQECWCVYDPELESINQFNDVDLPCDYACAGDATETCGGVDAMSVYVISGDGPTVVEPYTQKDCYVDLRDGSRVMEVKMATSSSTTMSAQICYEMCANESAGYTYFGLQYSYECWCSTTLSDSETTDGAICESPCSNNADETCGGLDAIMAYEIN